MKQVAVECEVDCSDVRNLVEGAARPGDGTAIAPSVGPRRRDEMGLKFLHALGCSTSPPSETTVVATQTATPSSTSPAPRGDARSKRPALRHEEALQREPSASGPPRSAGSWWTRVGLMVLAAAAVGGGIFLWMSRDQSTGSDKGQNAARESPASGQDESKNKAALRVNVVKPHKGGMARTTTQPGTLHAFQYADLYAKASGYLPRRWSTSETLSRRASFWPRFTIPSVSRRSS